MKDYILLLNKPRGITSSKLINKYKYENKEILKIGHAGTLDPMAEGLILGLINGATKLSDDLMHQDKIYEVEMILGYETDTLDLEGKIINKDNNKNILSDIEIKNTILSFIGVQEQIPPKYSAIKINGKKLYELARKNIDIEIKSREVNIYNISNIKIYDKDIISENNSEQYPIYYDNIIKVVRFKVKVSSGTYIRSLVRDIAYKIGTYGTMSALKRTQIGEFLLENRNRPIGLKDIFPKNKIILSEKEIFKLQNGVAINIEYKGIEGDIINIYNEKNEFIGLAKIYSLIDNIGVLKRYKYMKKGD